MTNPLYDIPLKQIDGTASSLARYRFVILPSACRRGSVASKGSAPPEASAADIEAGVQEHCSR